MACAFAGVVLDALMRLPFQASACTGVLRLCRRRVAGQKCKTLSFEHLWARLLLHSRHPRCMVAQTGLYLTPPLDELLLLRGERRRSSLSSGCRLVWFRSRRSGLGHGLGLRRHGAGTQKVSEWAALANSAMAKR